MHLHIRTHTSASLYTSYSCPLVVGDGEVVKQEPAHIYSGIFHGSICIGVLVVVFISAMLFTCYVVCVLAACLFVSLLSSMIVPACWRSHLAFLYSSLMLAFEHLHHSRTI